MCTTETTELLTEQEKRDLFKANRHQKAIDAIVELQDDLLKPIAQRAIKSGDVNLMEEVSKRLPENEKFYKSELQTAIRITKGYCYP